MRAILGGEIGRRRIVLWILMMSWAAGCGMAFLGVPARPPEITRSGGAGKTGHLKKKVRLGWSVTRGNALYLVVVFHTHRIWSWIFEATPGRYLALCVLSVDS